MNLSRAVHIAQRFIADRETFSPTAYYDVNGYAIGYGNHYYRDGSLVSSGDTIDQGSAWELLGFYVLQNAKAIMDQIRVPVTENQLAALTSLRYNCGTVTKDLLFLINSGAPESQVTEQFARTCITSGGVYNPDLVVRRQLEIGLYTSTTSILTALPFVLAAFLAWLAYRLLK